uniref:YprB ribonuclease H-like domain-containing protein n=1 Tax=viral metagenome TaxID=1070528 RepID=A0A6C0KCX3_9ZZZZ
MKNIRDLIMANRLPVATRTRSRMPRIAIPQQEWISVTELDNFCQNDFGADWCEALRKDDVGDRHSSDSLLFLFEKGKEYENYVMSNLRQKTGLTLDRHSSHSTSRLYNERDGVIDSRRVVESMKRGDPVIYSAYLADRSRYLRGIPDLLVRNDQIHILFNTNTTIPYGTSRFGNYYYIPVEIKFSTICLTADGRYVSNEGRSPFYKTQLYAYSSLLQTIQGWQPSCAFIIGKRTVHKDDIYSSLDRPGYIDYAGHDISVISKFHDGLAWLRRVKKYGSSWDISEIRNFPPNMKYNPSLDKKEIAIASSEITEIWQCGVHQRQRAYDNGIYSWNDQRLTAELMNIPVAYQNEVNAILKVNRGELGIYHPMSLSTDLNSNSEMFVDFETFNDTFDIQSPLLNPECIFLIGVYYKNKYYSFKLPELTQQDEKTLIMSFYQFWEKCGKPVCWFWYAETELWRRALLRHQLVLESPVEWRDLYKIVRDETFVVKGCKNFKLKSYIKALSDQSLIPLIAPPDTCGNGLEAMVTAWKHYKETKDPVKMKEVVSYNKFDCIALSHLLTFLRTL